jgi:diguanylate cyclase (GGDEF)-like protein/PAS domain S-box-containing protein
MTPPLNILFVEDNPADFMLLERFLHQQGMVATCHRVASHNELDAALQQEWDVVITDYNLPGMDFVSVVRRVKARLPDVPIILVSGSLEEGAAAEMLRVGLTDFILKAHLVRLPAAIRHAIQEATDHHARLAAEIRLKETQTAALEAQRQARIAALNLMEDAVAARERAEAARRALQSSEEKYRLLSENSADCIFWKNADGRFKYISPSCERMTGYAVADFLADAQLMERIIHPDDQAAYQQHLLEHSIHAEGELEYRLYDKAGELHWISHRCQSLFDTNGAYLGRHGTNRDITVRKAAEAQRHLLSEALRQSAQPLLLVDMATCITYLNPAFSRLFGYELSDLFGKNVDCLTHRVEENLRERTALIEGVLAKGTWSGEVERIAKDGTVIPTVVSIGTILDEQGKQVGYVGSYLDLRPLREKEMLLRKLSMAVEQSPGSIAITDLDANIEYVNDSFVRNTGYTREEMIGTNQNILHSGKTPPQVYESLWKSLKAGEIWQGEMHNQRKDGSSLIEHVIISPIRQTDGSITHYVAVKEDITEKKRAEAEIHRLAFYDTLTGLPNRALLLELLAQTLAAMRHLQQFSALISFNIDRFKTINDAAGQALGDKLLQAVGERLTRLLDRGDVVARVSGDEFCILLTLPVSQQHTAAHDALRVAEKLHSSLRQPFGFGDERFTLTACLGIALLPEGLTDTPFDVIRRANTALHHAKHKGSAQTAFFDGSLDEVAKQRFNVERELRLGIAAGELRMFLQSQVDANGKAVGAETLVRWQHPQRGLVPPGAFIPIAEESNLIVEIGGWIFNQVCDLLVREEMLDETIRISVNISPRHFRQVDFVEQIKLGLARTGAAPTRLTLEVTEGMVIDNINDVIAKMNELNAMGIHFSMDDFGTGYSSLSYLKRLPFNELKIDKSFVQDMTTDANDAALVETILSVAHHMHLKVVAEGVETQEQADFLNQRAQVIHQGYLFCKPEPMDVWLTKFKSSCASKSSRDFVQ